MFLMSKLRFFKLALMPQALFFPVTYKKMRLVARINSDQVSKTDVTTSSYEGFQFCIDARECLNQTSFEHFQTENHHKFDFPVFLFLMRAVEHLHQVAERVYFFFPGFRDMERGLTCEFAI